jgi:streptogramin lyase
VPETGVVQTLVATAAAGTGCLRLPVPVTPASARAAPWAPGEALVLSHHYRRAYPARGGGKALWDGRYPPLAVAVAPDGTVWAGGDGGGNLYHVPPRASMAG